MTYFDKPSDLAPVTKARSVDINNLAALIAAAFGKLPDELDLKMGTVNYAVNTGPNGTAYSVVMASKITTYADGLEVRMRPVKDNTGACTLNVNGIGAIAIKRADGTDPQAGDIIGSTPIALTYQVADNVFHLPAVVNSQIIQAASSSAQAEASAAAAAGSAAIALKTLAIESNDPPANPMEGQEWIDAATGRRFTFIESQWAETYASQVVDQPTLVDQLRAQLGASTGAGIVSWMRNAIGAVVRFIADKMAERVSPEDFGADPTGAADSSPAFAKAIAHLKTKGGGVVECSSGAAYLLNGIAGADGTLNGILQPYTSDNGTGGRIRLRGNGARLLAGSANMIVLRTADSHNGGYGFVIDGNGNANVTGHAICPESMTQTNQLVSQSYNSFDDVYVTRCTEAVVLGSGPTVGGLDSGCFYNRLTNYKVYDNVRGLWLKSPTGPAGKGSPVNRNTFDGWRIGQGRTNTGLQLDAGDTNVFRSFSVEGVTAVAGPNAVATAIKIAKTDAVSGLDNNHNKFFGCTIEGCTRDLDNANPLSEFYALTASGAKLLLTATPAVMIGGADASVMPQITSAYVHQNNGYVAGIDSGVMWMKAGLALLAGGYLYDQGFKWQAWPITLAQLTNVTSFDNVQSRYQRRGGMVDWVMRLHFQATAANTNVVVKLPRTPAAAQYTSFGAQQPMYFPYVAAGATGVALSGVARMDAADPTTIIFFPPTGGWHAGPYSEIHVNLRYMESGF